MSRPGISPARTAPTSSTCTCAAYVARSPELVGTDSIETLRGVAIEEWGMRAAGAVSSSCARASVGLGPHNLAIPSIYLQGIDNADIIETTHARRSAHAAGQPDHYGPEHVLDRGRGGRSSRKPTAISSSTVAVARCPACYYPGVVWRLSRFAGGLAPGSARAVRPPLWRTSPGFSGLWRRRWCCARLGLRTTSGWTRGSPSVSRRIRWQIGRAHV